LFLLLRVIVISFDCRLSKLDLSNHQFSVTHMLRLSQVLISNRNTLRELNLSGDNLTCTHLQQLAMHMTHPLLLVFLDVFIFFK
jgi:hypothetical protein